MKAAEIPGEARLAGKRIAPYVRKTILERSSWLSDISGADVWCKLENLQHTGSFKVRGAMNRILTLDESEIEGGVVTASTGNHGAAVSHCLGVLGRTGIIFVPENADEGKVHSIVRNGGEIRRHGTDNAQTEIFAREFAAERGMVYISPYNDPMVIAGQGTIGLEILEELDGFCALFASLGGGGLVSGIAGAVRAERGDVEIVACSPENSRVMMESVKAGRILDIPSLPTLSDGTAGGLEPGAITFELCRALVDRYVAVTEDEIKENILGFLSERHMLIEGAAAVSVAAFLGSKEAYRGRRVVIVICGGNVSLGILRDLLL